MNKDLGFEFDADDALEKESQPQVQAQGASAVPPPSAAAQAPERQAQAPQAPPQPSQEAVQHQQAIANLQGQLKQAKVIIDGAKEQLAIAQAIAAKEKQRTEDLTALVNRLQADFDNYRKRTNESVKKAETDGVVKIIEKILPCLDVFKTAVTMITDEKIAEGVKMIYRQLNDVLSSFGVEEIPALGERFDPMLHDAVVQVKVKDKAQVGLIVEVFNKGYKLGDRIIRHSRVKVAN